MKTFKPILFHRPNNLVSKAIRSVTGSYWNHAGALIWIDGDWWLLEAVENGVVLWLWSEAKAYYDKFNCEYKICYDIPMRRDFKNKVNKGYEYFALLKDFAYYTSMRFFGDCWLTKYLSNIDNPKRFVCFELIAYLRGDAKPWGATGVSFDSKKNI